MSKTTNAETTNADLRALDAEVAVEVMGWRWYQLSIPGLDGAARRTFDPEFFSPEDAARYPSGGWRAEEVPAPAPQTRGSLRGVPCYSTDIAAAWEVEAEIERRGLHFEYGGLLFAVLDSGFLTVSYFDLLHASPEMRCRAALQTVRAAGREMQDAP